MESMKKVLISVFIMLGAAAVSSIGNTQTHEIYGNDVYLAVYYPPDQLPQVTLERANGLLESFKRKYQCVENYEGMRDYFNPANLNDVYPRYFPHPTLVSTFIADVSCEIKPEKDERNTQLTYDDFKYFTNGIRFIFNRSKAFAAILENRFDFFYFPNGQYDGVGGNLDRRFSPSGKPLPYL